jgi:DNA-binding response OmpR family regulator
MTGFAMWARLARARAVPVIFITARDDPGDEARAMQGGAIAFLRKPFDDEALLAAIRTVVALTPTTPSSGERS